MNTVKTRALVLVLMLPILGTGCILAFNEAWLPRDVFAAGLEGKAWQVAHYGDAESHEMPKPPWTFTLSEALHSGGKTVPALRAHIQDPKGRPAEMELVFFKVGKNTFCQSRVLSSGANEVADVHAVSLRSVSRVEQNADGVAFYPLDRKAVLADKKRLRVREMDGKLVIRASTATWQKALKTNSDALFAKKPLIQLKAIKAP
jgi:hypothetical protein